MAFEEIPLGELMGEKGYIRGPFGSALKRAELKESGIPVYEQQHAIDGTRSFRYFVDEDKYRELRRFTVEPNDLIISCSGTVGRISVIQADDPKGIISQALLILRPDIGKVIPLYLYYFLTSKVGAQELVNASQGAVQLNIAPRNIVERIPVPLPGDIDAQERIVNQLKVLDDKINLNRRINQTLEAMAQAIFKSWFVDFDPVKAKIVAKAEGRDPLRAAMTAISGKPDAELDTLPPDQFATLAATAALFPDEMEASELGPIPAGWLASRIGDITARVAMGPFGSDIKKDNFVEAGVPVIRGGNLTAGLMERNYVFLTESKADALKSANAFPGDIVITHRGTLGQVGLIPQRSKFPRYVVSQSQMLLSVDRARMSPRYLFEFLRSDTGKQQLLSNTSQVGVPAIARPTGSVKALPLVVPPKAVLDAYDDLLKPILLKLPHLADSTETLAKLRDALLPRLLSGDLKVQSVEMDVEA